MQKIRTVADDAVDPLLNELAHSGGIVHCPDDHPETGFLDGFEIDLRIGALEQIVGGRKNWSVACSVGLRVALGTLQEVDHFRGSRVRRFRAKERECEHDNNGNQKERSKGNRLHLMREAILFRELTALGSRSPHGFANRSFGIGIDIAERSNTLNGGRRIFGKTPRTATKVH